MNKVVLKWVFVWFSIALTFVFVGCKEDHGRDFSDFGGGLAPDTLKNDYAEAFQIIYHESGAEINIIDPITKERLGNYWVRKEYTPDYNVFDLEIERVAVMSSTHIGMLGKLNLEDKIVGVPSFKYLCHPLNHSSVSEIGEISTTDPEIIMEVNPDVIFYSGYNMNAPILNKLEQANLKTFLIYEWKETHPLGRAEWIKVFGLLMNKEKEAKSIYDNIKNEYKKIVSRLQQVENRPTVLAGTYFGDVFNAPAGESFVAQFFKDVNIDYVYSNTLGTGSLNLSLEEVISDNKETDFWVNASAGTKEELLGLSKKFELLSSVKKGKIYSYIKNNDCFWENSPVEPHKILEDFGKIFHPEAFDDEELNYYSRIQKI